MEFAVEARVKELKQRLSERYTPILCKELEVFIDEAFKGMLFKRMF